MFLQKSLFKNNNYNKYPLKKLTVIFCSIFLSFSTSLYAHNNFHKSKQTLKGPIADATLGEGYATLDNISSDSYAIPDLRDAKFTTKVDKNLSSTITIEQQISRSEESKELNLGAEASIGWGLFSASAAANYMKSTKDTETSQNFSFSQRFYLDSYLKYQNIPYGSDGKGHYPALSAAAQSAFNAGPKVFEKLYGDSFIVGLKKGVIILANVKLQFSTKASKESFDTKFKASYGTFGSLSASVSSAQSASKAKGSLVLYAFQSGGDPTQLAKIFASPSEKGIYVTSCSLDNIANCSNIINNVINYAANLNKQLYDASGKLMDDRLSNVGEPMTKSYHDLIGLPIHKEVLSYDATVARDNLNKQYTTLNDNYNNYVNLVSQYPAYSKFAQDEIDKLKYERDYLTTKGIKCYTVGEENHCPLIYQDIENQIRKTGEIGLLKISLYCNAAKKVAISTSVFNNNSESGYHWITLGFQPVSTLPNFFWNSMESNWVPTIDGSGNITKIALSGHFPVPGANINNMTFTKVQENTYSESGQSQAGNMIAQICHNYSAPGPHVIVIDTSAQR